MSERNQAPRRLILSSTKTTGYGTTRHVYRLECGHTLRLKREAPRPAVGCTECLRDSRVEAMIEQLDVEPLEPFSLEEGVRRLRAQLAGHFGVPQEMVQVQFDGRTIGGASVWLDMGTIHDLLALG